MGRRKPVQACSRCQKRKIKCDRARPCAPCLRNSAAALCVYEEQEGLKKAEQNGIFKVFGVSKKTDLKHRDPLRHDASLRNHLLRTVGNKVDTSSKDRINFHYRPTLPLPDEPEVQVHGPLEWSFIERKDPALHMLLRSFRQSKPSKLSLNLSVDGTELELNSKKENVMKHLTFSQKVESILPHREITWFLINIFFRYLYIYLPFLDERSFTAEILRIIGSKELRDQTITLSITRYDDNAFVGILLVLLRMTYLLLNLKNDGSQDPVFKIDSTIIEIATSSLNEYKVTDNVTLTKLQCGLYLKLYQRIAPEFGEGIQGEKNGIRTSMLVQMAYSLGLNKVAKNIGRREIILRQKIWHMLVIYDMVDAYTIGTPMISNKLFCEPQPIYEGEVDNSSSNSVVLEDEKITLLRFSSQQDLYAPLNKILVLVWNVAQGTKISVFLKAVNKLEGIAAGKYGFFLSYLTSVQQDSSVKNECIKSHKAKVLLFIKILLLSLYLHLVIFYEEKGNTTLKLFYEEKSQITINTELMPGVRLLSDDMTYYFGTGVLTIATYFLQIINRAHLLNISMYIKLKYHLCHHQKIYSSNGEIVLPSFYLQEAIGNLEKCIYVFMKSMSKISVKYVYAERTYHLLKIYLKIVSQKEFYTSKSTLGKLPYTTDFLKKLTSIYGSSLKRLEVSSKEKYSYDLSEYVSSESIDSPEGDITDFSLTCDKLLSLLDFSLLDFSQQIWVNEFV